MVSVMNKDKKQPGPGKSDLMIVLTRKCQFRCRYCRLDFDKKPETISKATLRRAIDFLFTSKARNLEIQFFGGEPLLCFGLLKEGILYAEKLVLQKGRKCRFCVTTNALAATQNQLKFLKARDAAFLISLDGAANTHKKNRPLHSPCPSPAGESPEYPYDKIIKNVRAIIAAGVHYKVNMVVSPEDAHLIGENVDALGKLGIGNIQPAYALCGGWNEKSEKYFLNGLKKLLSGRAKTAQDPDAEPVLISPQISVDTDGTVCVGCASVLEKTAPELSELFRIGPVAGLKDFDAVRRTRKEQWNLLKKNLAQNNLPRFIRSILLLGVKTRRCVTSVILNPT